MKSHSLQKRRPAAALALVGLLAVLGGCAQLEFDTYSCYEDWMVAREDPFDPEDLGVDTEKHGAVDYLLNTGLIRTPIFALYDTSRCVLSVITLPYYALGGGAEASTTKVDDLPIGPAAKP